MAYSEGEAVFFKKERATLEYVLSNRAPAKHVALWEEEKRRQPQRTKWVLCCKPVSTKAASEVTTFFWYTTRSDALQALRADLQAQPIYRRSRSITSNLSPHHLSPLTSQFDRALYILVRISAELMKEKWIAKSHQIPFEWLWISHLSAMLLLRSI